MASSLPAGESVASNEALLAGATWRALGNLGAYVHIPFCRVRCGYCDFNTYTATELRGVSQSEFASVLMREIELSQSLLKESGAPTQLLTQKWDTVFFGGGTPTLLPAEDLAAILDALRRTRGIAPDAEVTVEANPDTLNVTYAERLAAAGVTRVSIGMQSAVPAVLATLDRTHNPENVSSAVRAARAAGLSVSVDLIYGTPGESLEQWQQSVDAALQLQTEHISAYALIVEEGTALARRIASGELSMPDDDLMADMYEAADRAFSDAGLQWYEISNWSSGSDTVSRHNHSYWGGGQWWGYGPGAHSYLGGIRWWNVKHPAAYADRLSAGHLPVAAREVLTEDDRALEEILLLTRCAEGYLCRTEQQLRVLDELVAEGLAETETAPPGRLVLTVEGRLRADEIVRRLTQ